MEYLDLYDENGNNTGKTMIRGNKVPRGMHFNVVICFIKNSKGEYLIQKTSKQKGNLYSLTGGHVQSGQTFIEAMIREIKEEIGVEVKAEELQYLMEYIKNGEVGCQIYLLEKDIDISQCKLQEEEVESIHWITVEEIKKLKSKDMFNRTHAKLFEKIMNL